jgi:hypothetical protein
VEIGTSSTNARNESTWWYWEVEPAIGPPRTARRADHHRSMLWPIGSAPVVAFGEQVVDRVDPAGIEL